MKRVKTDEHYKWEANRKGDSHILYYIYTLSFVGKAELGVLDFPSPRQIRRHAAYILGGKGFGNENNWTVTVHKPLAAPTSTTAPNRGEPYAVHTITGLKEAKAWAEVMVRMMQSSPKNL